MRSSLLSLLFLCSLSYSVYSFRTQSVAVTGQLYCGDIPASNVLVKLFDDDQGPDSDDELGKGHTDEQGRFSLTGSAMELTNIDPEIRIYHDCNDHGRPCQRKWVIRIPSKYISPGEEPKEVMDFGRMNLEIELEDEIKDCDH